MAASSRRQQQSGPFHNQGPCSSGFASSSSTFSAPGGACGGFFQRTTSTTPTPSVRFSLERSTSPGRSISAAVPRTVMVKKKKTCMCSPTNHPGSFRCSLHKNSNSSSYSPNRLNARRSAMTNSLVRIGGVEGELVKRALAVLIRPSSHQQRRRNAFQPRPSRLSLMSKAY